jgi:hypothetical protein
MSWASRRRTAIILGFLVIFTAMTLIPLAIWIYEPATCFDGKQNQGETAIDQSGPCALLDERTLIPHATLWARSFGVRDGRWSAVAYIENPNDFAGVAVAPYRFKLYDERNILVSEGEGASYIMPGTITPIYEGGFDTGNRKVARAYFEFTAPLVWERMHNTANEIEVTGKSLLDVNTAPRVIAIAENVAVSEAREIEFVAAVFDQAGNAMASSRTIIPLLPSDGRENLVFTWPEPFPAPVGRIDVIPLRAPAPATVGE